MYYCIGKEASVWNDALPFNWRIVILLDRHRWRQNKCCVSVNTIYNANCNITTIWDKKHVISEGNAWLAIIVI